MGLFDRQVTGLAAALLAFVMLSGQVQAEPTYGIAMYGKPALPPDFVSLPYANPEAPKGGKVTFGENGTFDSLNPFILTGTAATGITVHTVETLMARSIDEPFSLYGLLAESIETPDDRSWVEFTLRPQAKFSDGHPVTPEDVIWSMETLGTKGQPRYATAWAKVTKIEKTGERKVKITFNAPDRELPLLMGLRPILEKAQWDGKDFSADTTTVPTGSGPYIIDSIEPGRFITYRRNPDYWAKDLPIARGLNNLDEIRYDYFADPSVTFQAFTAGDIAAFKEGNAAKWQTNYAFPAVASGDVVLEEIPNQRPSGITGLVINTRNPLFKDWRVREALIDAFNFEFVNQTITGGLEPRITSYFANSVLATDHAPATGKVAELLQPFADDLLPGTMEGYSLPVGNSESSIDRGNIRKALHLLEDAGWTTQDGVLKDKAGKPFAFEILLPIGSADAEATVAIYVEALKKLGIAASVANVDAAQFQERTGNYAFDMTWYSRALSLSPGNEQTLYWGSKGADQPGSRNWMGMKSPAAEAMIAKMVGATNTEDFITATQALDRILIAGRYVVPMWYSKVSRLAHTKHLHHPEYVPLYGDWPGFMPDVWWFED